MSAMGATRPIELARLQFLCHKRSGLVSGGELMVMLPQFGSITIVAGRH
jgi:hypothetical protein